MTIKLLVSDSGGTRELLAEEGVRLSDALRLGHVPLDMPCSGRGTCKACRVKVDGEEVLACETKVERDVRVELPAKELRNIAAGVVAGKPRNPMFERYGLAADIGTSTICASLLDRDGNSATTARKNPQTAFGADVISRIERSLAGGADELARSVRDALAEMAEELAARLGITINEIDGAVVTGNTAMLYLLTGRSPDALSHAPFDADCLFGGYASGLGFLPNARVYLPRCASAFVGGDVTTAILASGMCERDETALLVDVGTNGELALWHKGNLTCCSTAAGPAFEGAGISRGMYGGEGAVDHCEVADGEVRCHVIGEGKAVGICGSGIVDALAAMLSLEIIDETGAFEEGDSFPLRDGVSITAADVRKIQLAKGSLRAGVETLLATSDVGKEAVSSLLIAGGFGSYLDLENAAAIGLIPPELLPRARALGNAAHTGAAMLLADRELAERTERLAGRAKTVRLDANPVFTEFYMEAMLF